KIEPGDGEFIRADAVKYLERMGRKGSRFDLIILDPPSFSRYENKVFSVKKDLVRLIGQAVDLLDTGGRLFVSTNSRGMTHSDLSRVVTSGAEGRRHQRIEFLGPDIDFPEKGKNAESHLVAAWVEF
ncbi:MAG: class I SAM-dependent methyltransferase, partial [Thermodesulfobacteriota bacterium]